MQSYIVYMGESSFSPSSSSGEKSFSESSLTTLDVKAMTKSHFDMLGTYLDRFLRCRKAFDNSLANLYKQSKFVH